MILAVPPDKPVTIPAELTVATLALSLLQLPVPPLNTTEFAVYAAELPEQIADVPVTDATFALGLTVTVVTFEVIGLQLLPVELTIQRY